MALCPSCTAALAAGGAAAQELRQGDALLSINGTKPDKKNVVSSLGLLLKQAPVGVVTLRVRRMGVRTQGENRLYTCRKAQSLAPKRKSCRSWHS